MKRIKIFSFFLALCLCLVCCNISSLALSPPIYTHKILMNKPYSSIINTRENKFTSKLITSEKEFTAFLPQCYDTFYNKEEMTFDSEFFKENSLIVLSTKSSSSISYDLYSLYSNYVDKTLVELKLYKHISDNMKEDCVDYTILVSIKKEFFNNAEKLKLEVTDNKYTFPNLEGKEIKYNLVHLDSILDYKNRNEETEFTLTKLISTQEELRNLNLFGDLSVFLTYDSDFFKTKSIILLLSFLPYSVYEPYPAELMLQNGNKLLLNLNRLNYFSSHSSDIDAVFNYALEIEKKDIMNISHSTPIELFNVDVLYNNYADNEINNPILRVISSKEIGFFPEYINFEGLSFNEYINEVKEHTGDKFSVNCYESNSQPVTDLNKLLYTGAMIQFHFKFDEKYFLISRTILVDGDVDCNGVVTATDARLVLRASAELDDLSLPAKLAAISDRAGTRVITAASARELLSYSAGLESLFMCRDFSWLEYNREFMF